MRILGRCKHSVPTLLVILIFFASKSTSDESVEVKNDVADKASPVPAIAKVQEGKSDDADNTPSNSEENPDDAKSEQNGQLESPNEKEENQYAKPEESVHPPQVISSETKQSNEKVEEADQHPSVPQEAGQHPSVLQEAGQQPSVLQEEKSDENKLQAVDGPQKVEPETKKQNAKIDENSRKISLSDVNSITYDDSQTKQVKRETRTTEFLGLPRDASYFFDDLEPFINNNSAKDNSQENARASRSVPARESKSQKAKLGGKRDMEEEADEEEEDDNEKVEEDEDKASEGDYDDDEDMEPDCQPTTTADPCDEVTESTECSQTTTGATTTQCTTTPKSTTIPKCTTKATTCANPRRTTTKCTTRFTCPTKCPTTVESTKCPRICAKANRKNIGYPPTTRRTPEWDDQETNDPHSTEQKPHVGESVLDKKRFHSKSNSGKIRH